MSKANYPEFIELIKNYEIIGIQESKTDDCDDIKVPGYNVYFNNRENLSRRKSGGIALLIKEEIQKYVKVEKQHSSQLVLWFSISKELLNIDNDVLCGVVYVPPIGSKYKNEDPFAELHREIIRKKSEHSQILLMGDFNSRTGERTDIFISDEFLSDLYGLDFLELESNNTRNILIQNNVPIKRCNIDKVVNAYGTQMLEFCKLCNLCIVNGRIGRCIYNSQYTCKDSSVVDYFICSPSLFSKIQTLHVLDHSRLYSDAHCPVSLSLRARKRTNTIIGDSQTIQDNIRLWNAEKSKLFQDNFYSQDLTEIDSRIVSMANRGALQQHELDAVVNQIGVIFEKCAEKSFGRIKPTSKTKIPDPLKKPWFDKSCHRARNEYHRARQRYNLNKNNENKTNLKHVSKFYKYTMNLNIKKYKEARIQTLKSLKNPNPRKFWNLLNANDPKADCQAPLKDLYDYFKSVNENQNGLETDLPQNGTDNDDTINEELNKPISESEVRAAVKQLQNNKSAGLDNIKNEHIKSTSEVMIPIYTKLFNLIFDSAIIPESWSLGTIRPIYKKGDPVLPKNYRPITILSCLGKMFTSVLNNRLKVYSDKYNVIESCQAGFRSKHSTVDNIFIIKCLIDIAKANKTKLFGCFIDFKQAFDMVWRNGLWNKLLSAKINGKFLAVIQSIYHNVKSNVITQEGSTIFFPCLTGVRQGENLSPLLFSLYLNDLNHYMFSNNAGGSTCEFNSEDIYIYLKIMLLLYADDTVLFSETERDMLHALNVFQTYCNTWRLTVNVDKTKIVIFSSGKLKQYNFLLNGLKIEVTNEYKYLGIHFTRGGSFAKAKQHIADQASKAMFSLLKKIRALNLPLDLQLELFDKMIKPILLYGAEIWGFGNCDVIERVHLKFLKHVLHLKKSTPSHMIYGELGIFPITLEIRHRMLTYWCKIIADCNVETLGTQKLSTYVYSLVFSMNRNNNINSLWLKNVKQLLCELGFSGVWDSQYINNTKWLCAALKQKLKDQYIQDWLSKTQKTCSSNNYRLIKNTFERSAYLHLIPDKMAKILFAFRTRNHRLPVERGSWISMPLRERKCQHCNDLGDEFHYLFQCKLFSTERRKYLKPYYYRNPNILKYNEIMNMTNITSLKKLSIFINKIMTLTR